jgi:hypothetical protein
MRNCLALLSFVTCLTIVPVLAHAHGSNVFESADTSAASASDYADAAHDGHSSAEPVDEFEELHDEIHNLKDQLSAHDERVRIADIVGGIGYIVGIAGVAYYYFGTRRGRPQ